MVKSLLPPLYSPMTLCLTVMWLSVISCCAMLGFVVYKTMNQDSVANAVLKCEGNTGALPLRAQVAGCASVPCALPERRHAVVDVHFQAPRNTSNMTTVASAYIFLGFEMEVPYDVGEAAAACNYLTHATCPVHQGQLVTLKLRIYVPSTTVTMPATVEFSVVDDQAEPMMCIRVPIVITAGRDQREQLDGAPDAKYNEVNYNETEALHETSTK